MLTAEVGRGRILLLFVCIYFTDKTTHPVAPRP